MVHRLEHHRLGPLQRQLQGTPPTEPVNSKYVFDIQVHYSKISEVVNQATIFTVVWLVILIWTILSLKLTGAGAVVFNFIPSDYLPPFTWAVYIIYYLIPSKKFFNGKTRFFVKLLIVDMFKSPFFDFKFIIPWATDQFLSFAVSLRDFFFTFCYSVRLGQNGTILDNQCSTNTIVSVFEAIMVFIPLYLRMAQCLNRVYFAKNRYGKWKNFANFMKYLLSTITVIFSLLIKSSGIFIYFWIVFVVCATIYSYYWDLKYDFGLLEVEEVDGRPSALIARQAETQPAPQKALLPEQLLLLLRDLLEPGPATVVRADHFDGLLAQNEPDPGGLADESARDLPPRPVELPARRAGAPAPAQEFRAHQRLQPALRVRPGLQK